MGPSFAFVIAQAPDETLLAQRVARSLLQAGASLGTVFLLRDGVHHATRGSAAAQAWRSLAEHGARPRLVACSAALERRDLGTAIDAETFEVVGLGQLVEALGNADRLIEFP